MTTRRSIVLAGALLVALGGACSGGHSSTNPSANPSTNGSGAAPGTNSKTATVKVPPVHDGDLHSVLDDWIRRNHAPGAVIGVQIGAGTPVFAVAGDADPRAHTAMTDTTALPVGGVADAFVGAAALQLSQHGHLDLDTTVDRWLPRLPNAKRVTVRDLLTHRRGVVASWLGDVVAAVRHTDLATALHDEVLGPMGLRDTSYAPSGMVSTPRDLLAFSVAYFRARVHGEHDLAASVFRVGPGGNGLGVQGLSDDGFCAVAPHGCAPGTPFFAVGASGAVAGRSAVVVYDPVYDVSIVALASSDRVDLEDLALRADLLAKIGKAAYDKTVGFTAQPSPTTTGS